MAEQLVNGFPNSWAGGWNYAESQRLRLSSEEFEAFARRWYSIAIQQRTFYSQGVCDYLNDLRSSLRRGA